MAPVNGKPRRDCPYVGLQPYSADDTEYFFGREQDLQTIAANVVAAPLTILYGSTGVGKSSVLEAGVMPYLRKLAIVTPVSFRDWQHETFLSALKAGIARAVAERLKEPFEAQSLSLDELLIQAARRTGSLIAVILDQFEEYFLYHREGSAGAEFDSQFARAVNRDDVPARFLISTREDALSLLDRFQKRIPRLFGNYLRLEHLDRGAAERAIGRPLTRYSQDHEAVTIEKELVKELVEDVRTKEPETGNAPAGQQQARIQIETPLLQMVLMRLWDREMAEKSRVLRLSTFESLGRAKKIAESYLGDVMEKLTPAQKETCDRIFDRLVTPSRTKVACNAEDLEKWSGDSRAESAVRAYSLVRGQDFTGGAAAARRAAGFALRDHA